jgi:two-component system, OmpR family, phosphate regulon sensor histidine kinase PhoR
MRRRRVRLTWLVTGATAAAVLAGGAVVYRTLAGALRDIGVSGSDAAHVTSAVAIPLILLGLLGVTAATIFASRLAGSLGRLRGRVSVRESGDDLASSSMITEMAALEHAVERQALRVADRDREMERGGVEVSAVMDAISEGILQLDAAGRIVRANPRARVLLGLDSASIGMSVATKVRHAELRLLLDRAVGGTPLDAMEIGVDDRRLLVSARPLGGDAALTRGAVVAFVDLTEVRRLESVRRDFVANVSHELKTPLTSIRGYTETMLNDELAPELQRQFLEVVHKNADRLQRIVDDLLDLSRLESGGWRPEPQPVDVADMVTEAWSACAGRARDRSITFVPPAAGAMVMADPGGLRQVLANLLENAVRYTAEGGLIEVRVATDPAMSAHVSIEVRDNGAGIPSDALPRIFERFYRVGPARSRADGGTGLGLSIVRHLVESMHGDVGAESELGKGTCIRVRLPAA